MKKLYMVRHGQSEANLATKWAGQMDVALTPKGEEQARTAAKKLQDSIYSDIEKIYCSSLKRAYDTAKIINQSLHLELEPCDELKEINLGVFQDQPKSILDDEKYADLKLSQKYNRNTKYPNGESIFDITQRYCTKIEEILSLHDSVLVVSHSRVARASIAYFVFNNLSQIDCIRLNNAAVSLVTFDEEMVGTLKLLNA